MNSLGNVSQNALMNSFRNLFIRQAGTQVFFKPFFAVKLVLKDTSMLRSQNIFCFQIYKVRAVKMC